jgi:hypothetical protein
MSRYAQTHKIPNVTEWPDQSLVGKRTARTVEKKDKNRSQALDPRRWEGEDMGSF